MAYGSSNISVPRGAIIIVPNDSAPQLALLRGVYVGVAGNVALAFRDGSSATFLNAPAGSVLQGEITHVFATGTTATNLIGLK